MKFLLVFYLFGTHNIIFQGPIYADEYTCYHDGRLFLGYYNPEHWNELIYFRCNKFKERKER
jgi:hypothetical protein